jgi:hypothetical protein
MQKFNFNNPGGLLNLNPNDTGSLGINISPINEQKKIDEEKAKRAERSRKLQDLADTFYMINANKSGNAQEAVMFSNRMAQRRAEDEARQLKAQKELEARTLKQQQEVEFQKQYNLLSPEQKILVDRRRVGIDLPQGSERKIIKGADGFNYYTDGTRVLPRVVTSPEASERQTIEGADGFKYYMDGTRVLPGVVKDTKASERKYEKAADGFYRYIDGDKEKVFGGIEIVDPKFIEPTEDNPLALSKKEIFDRTDKLSDDYRAGSKDFITIRDSMGKVLESAINPSPFGDLAIIFSAMKVLDPGSVVRESEFKTVEQAAPYLTRLGFDKNKIESFKEGKLLTPDQRADVVGTVLSFYNASNISQQGIMDYYANRAGQSGLKSENVIFDFGASVTPKIELFNYVNNLYKLDDSALILESQKQTDDEKKKLILKEFERRDK